MAKCAGCKRAISDRYLQAFGKAWHPACFKCGGCGRPVEGPFLEKSGKPWHENCYQAKFAKKCRRCNQPVSQGVNALGHAWHRECFQCTDCGQPITDGKYPIKDNQPYHESCYHKRFSKNCDVCGQPLSGKYLSDIRGNAFHPRHQKELSTCCSCDRLICEPLTGGGRVYADKRPICNICFDTAVNDQAGATAVFEDVRNGMEQIGFAFNGRDLPFRLSDAKELKTLSKKGRKDHPVLGLTRTQLKLMGKKVVAKNFQEILVIHGLPRAHFETVVAHELCHAWLFFNSFFNLPEKVEEGLCTLAEDFWLQKQGDDEAKIRLKRLAQNKDPVYGDGYRAAKAALKKTTFPKLLAYVKKNRALPGTGFLGRLFT